MIEKITSDELMIALIIKADFRKDGVEFFTPDHFIQQLGYMNRKKGYKVSAHRHQEKHLGLHAAQEVLIVRSGVVEISLFNLSGAFVAERILKTGDIILLAAGGHSLTMIEDAELIEVKSGPYDLVNDKIDIKEIS